MKKQRTPHSSFVRKAASAMLALMLYQIAFPTVSLALTSGPAQPEFSSFEPVSTTNMVSEHTGDFTYNLPVLNVPGPDGGSYALGLSYHSGSSPEEEASWVGTGWTLNPGAVMRSKKGFADDYKGADVQYWNQVPANTTISVGGDLNFEAYSIDFANVDAALRYNNYRGFGYTVGAGLSADGIVNLGYSYSDGQGSFSASISPGAILSSMASRKKNENEKLSAELKKSANPNDKESNRTTISKLTANTNKMNKYNKQSKYFPSISTSQAQFSNHVQKYIGVSLHFSLKGMPTFTALHFGIEGGLTGSVSTQQNIGDNGPNTADTKDVYGYMYSGSSSLEDDDVMDYSVDKDQPFQKRNSFVGSPFSNADQFNVTGEGLGGGFRMYQKSPGTYRPNSVASVTANLNGAINLAAGVENGISWRAGGSSSVLFQGDWNYKTDVGNFAAESSDENVFARFTNDMGGSIEYGVNDDAEEASLEYTGFPLYRPNINSIEKTMNNGQRSGRSTYVAWNTNEDMTDTYSSKKFRSYTKDADALAHVTRTVGSYEDGIGEFVSYSPNGQRYVYGLPVYSRKEQNMQYDVRKAEVKNNYVAYRDITDVNSVSGVKVGEISNTPYASTHLLTEITSPDYMDKTLNGPSTDDFGGWVRFSYNRIYGTNDKTAAGTWYKWRIPYTGLNYQRGELSTMDDDRGGLSYGEKEIYYLDTIETKTHYAVFITEDRNDAYDAASNETAANDSTAQGSNKLKKLTTIKLYARGQATPLKTVHFEYYEDDDANALCPGLPNSAAGGGKLTLKKVWFEYEGVVNTRIAPYVFEYAYSDANYPDRYDDLEDYKDGAIENPPYSPFSIDAWGNYQYDGASRWKNLKTWMNQGAQSANFDPAAWQLKVIKLPTGGEIHIQYEEDDYCYVQDKGSMALVSMKSTADNTKLYLRTSDISVSDASPTTNKKLKELRNAINKEYRGTGNKMYFKFLYSLIGYHEPSIGECTSEYIKGYTAIDSAGIDAGGLFVLLKDDAGCDMGLPDRVCRNYLRTQRAGNLNILGNCDASPPVSVGSNNKENFTNFFKFLSKFKSPLDAEICSYRNDTLSYLRIPMASNAKKGGGLRVKRILMYDKGLESNGADAVWYGNEYDYSIEENGVKMSSGVASNEPGGMREENPMVDFVKRSDPKYWVSNDPDKNAGLCKIIAGRDQEQQEGPIGESMMPGPSVGYRQVTIRNIHSGKTHTGVIVKQFFTYKEYPVLVKMTSLDPKRDKIPPISLIIFNMNVDNIYQSQGFSIIRSNLPGQLRKESTYSGEPSDKNSVISSETEYDYYQPPKEDTIAERIPLVSEGNVISWGYPGKETEIVFESREVSDVGGNVTMEHDIGIGYIPPFIVIPNISTMIYAGYNETKMYTHATTKVINYPAVVKSVRSMADGINHITYNVAFDAYSGEPLLTRTTDGFDALDLEQSLAHDGAYTNYSYAASHIYPDMGQKAENEGMRFSSGIDYKYTASADTLALLSFSGSSGSDSCFIKSKLHKGDLIQVSSFGFYNVASSGNGPIKLRRNLVYGSTLGTSGTTYTNVAVEIIRSGKDNKLTDKVGNVTTYGEDISSLFVSPSKFTSLSHSSCSASYSNVYKPDSNRVIAASAVVMSDSCQYTTYNNPFQLPAKGYKNDWEINIQGVWRPKSSYVFKDTIISANGATNRIYKDAGVFTGYKAFNWSNPGASSAKWIKASEVTLYSPNGAGLEEKDVLNIFSVAKYGYRNTVPYMTVQNADYESVQFESFENMYPTTGGYGYYEDGVVHRPGNGWITNNDTVTAHSGRHCFRFVDDGINGYDLKDLLVNTQMKEHGVSIKFWIRSSESDATLESHLRVTVNSAYNTVVGTGVTKVLARTGEWRLMEGKLAPEFFTYLADRKYFLIHDVASTRISTPIYFDDIRVQPMNAMMNCHVYDKDILRLLATFNDQHFGMYYQYNAEGKLIAKMIETEKGIKTVKETQYNTPMLYSKP
ncbi:MAG: hypothetical protein NT150_00335 [Bacteroidetes bacterium]|nr:hypothetical protein [Bacteroidota bacterium]